MARRYKTYSQKSTVRSSGVSADERKQIFIKSLSGTREMRLLKCQGDSALGRQRFYSEKLDLRHDSPFYSFRGVLTDTRFNISDNSDTWKHIDELEKEQAGLEAARRHGLKGIGHTHRIEALEQKIKFVEQGMQ